MGYKLKLNMTLNKINDWQTDCSWIYVLKWISKQDDYISVRKWINEIKRGDKEIKLLTSKTTKTILTNICLPCPSLSPTRTPQLQLPNLQIREPARNFPKLAVLNFLERSYNTNYLFSIKNKKTVCGRLAPTNRSEHFNALK